MTTYAEGGLRAREGATVGAFIRRGLAAGLAGGAAMAAFLLLVGESSIRQALVIEAARSGGEHGEELFSRSQQVEGGVIAALLYGLLLGAVFAVVYAATRSHRGPMSDFRRSVCLGAIGYVTVVVVPALKYPANPPGVGDPDSIGSRTVAYLTLLGASILLAVLVRMLWLRLRDRGFTEEVQVVVAGGVWFLAVALAVILWPANPDVVSLPAQLLWRFRLAALGGALALWTTLAIVFGWANARPALRRHQA
jgi:hypothetical protein